MAGEDPAYTRRVAGQPCLLKGTTPCLGEVAPHHPTHLRETGADARRAHDHYALPLCYGHHVYQLHALSGYFKGWTWQGRVLWEDARVREVQARLLTVPVGAAGAEDVL